MSDNELSVAVFVLLQDLIRGFVRKSAQKFGSPKVVVSCFSILPCSKFSLNNKVYLWATAASLTSKLHQSLLFGGQACALHQTYFILLLFCELVVVISQISS